MVSESFFREEQEMNKKLLELLDSINQKKIEVKNLADEGKLEEARTAKDELKELQEKFDLLKDLEDENTAEMEKKAAAGSAKHADNEDAIKKFADAARNGFRINNSMNEGTPADGGYTVPEDIQTRINTYRDASFSLLNLVRVESVSTEKGERTFKKRSQQTGFSKVGEGGKIGGIETPKFERLDYEISKYAGYFPVTNELLADTDANITGTLTEWIGNESRITANNLILEKIKSKAAVEVKDLDGIKRILNVTLGAAFKSTSTIVTNDNGLQYFDTLKDGTGRYLLAPDPKNTMEMRLAVGGTFVPVKVIPNVDLKNDEVYVLTKDTDIVSEKTYYTKSGDNYTEAASPVKASIATYYEMESRIPLIIGDLKEGIWYFDRKRTSIMVSNIAAIGDLNAFEQDLTIYRAIEREDVRLRDGQAYVNGYLVQK